MNAKPHHTRLDDGRSKMKLGLTLAMILTWTGAFPNSQAKDAAGILTLDQLLSIVLELVLPNLIFRARHAEWPSKIGPIGTTICTMNLKHERGNQRKMMTQEPKDADAHARPSRARPS